MKAKGTYLISAGLILSLIMVSVLCSCMAGKPGSSDIAVSQTENGVLAELKNSSGIKTQLTPETSASELRISGKVLSGTVQITVSGYYSGAVILDEVYSADSQPQGEFIGFESPKSPQPYQVAIHASDATGELDVQLR